jgi:hypothetical protein
MRSYHGLAEEQNMSPLQLQFMDCQSRSAIDPEPQDVFKTTKGYAVTLSCDMTTH